MAVKIRELPLCEQPVNRLQQYGPDALSTTELLAILQGNNDGFTSTARLLADYGSLAAMTRAPVEELMKVAGIGRVTACRIKAGLGLAIRLNGERDEKPQIRSPADAANLVLGEMGLLEQEEMRVMHLDTKNRVMGTHTVYRGSANTMLIRNTELFREAVRQGAVSIIVIHNHPSGDPTPSPEDVTATASLVEAGKLMDIQVMDHLIIGKHRFISLKERGLGF